MKKILIVDDEEDMIWSLQKNLNHESLKADIITASSGEESLNVLDQTPVDLIITDIKMPGISGLDLLVEVKNRFPNTGVIVMTAYPSPEYKSEAMAKGGLHYIEKPFDINELRKIVKETLKETGLFQGLMQAGRCITQLIGRSEIDDQIVGVSQGLFKLRQTLGASLDIAWIEVDA